MSALNIPKGWVKARTTKVVFSHVYDGPSTSRVLESDKAWPADVELRVSIEALQPGEEDEIFWATIDGSSYLLVYGSEVEGGAR